MPTVQTTRTPRTTRPTARSTPARWLRTAATMLSLWVQRRRQRSALADLDEHLLRDVGLTRAQALRESREPFWRR